MAGSLAGEVKSEEELLERALFDFEWYCENTLLVQDKQTHELVPFRFKPIQAQLAAKILERWIAGRPIRLIILKARREGVSTLIQAFFFWVTATRPNRHAVTIAHDDDSTKYLHGIPEAFYENLPKILQPKRKSAQAGKALIYGNPSKNPDEIRRDPGLDSSMRTITLKNMGRGQSATLLHLSEVAFWQGEQATKTLNGVLQIVPRAGQTIVVLESTAQGVGNEFARRWNEAVMQTSDYEAVFFPWFAEPTYRAPAPPDLVWTQDELNLAEQHDLDEEQLYWRRLTINSECGGSIDTFNEEYPATPEDAFLTTGRPYFNVQAIRRHAVYTRDAEPWATGRLERAEGHVRFIEQKIRSERHRPPVTIWHPPKAGEDYLIACDASEGSERSDFQAAYVFPRSTLRIDAAWHGRVDRDALGDELYMLGKLYNTALIAVEISGGWGMSAVTALLRPSAPLRPYPRVYRRTTVDRLSNERVIQLGWDTTTKTRPLALDGLNRALREDAIEVNDPFLVKECSTFVYDESGKPAAEGTAYDDRVLAASIGVYLWQTEPIRHRSELRQPARRVLSSTTGY